MQTKTLLRSCSFLALALAGCPSTDEGVTGSASGTDTESDTEGDEDSEEDSDEETDPTQASNSNSDTMVDTTEDPTDTDPTDTDPTDTDPTDTDPSDTDATTDTDPTDTDPTDTDPTDTDPSDTDSSTSGDPTDTDPTDSGSSSESTGAVSATDTDPTDTDPSDTDPTDSGDPNCEAPGELISCDTDTDDPFQAMGLGCEGGANSVIPISNTTFSSADPDAWKIASQLGTYIDPMTNEPLFSPREGDSFLLISTGHINDPNGQGVITMVDGDVYDSNSNPDNANLPAPMSINQGSNNGLGGTPFTNCDGVGDCSDTIEDQWNLGQDANDMLWFQFETEVPGGTNGWTMDFAYFSVEFPEWVDTTFNDIFLVWSDSETYTGNLCFVNDQPCTVTALWPVAHQQNAVELAGTGFQAQGGGTGWYTMQGSSEPGETLQLTTAVFDMGDTAYDTLVILDNWRWDCEGCVPSEVMGCGIEPTP